MSSSEKPGHSIRVASRLSSIPIETLRVWERRYGFPRPERTVGSNRRLYSDQDIERLQWIARALEHGYRAGDVVRRSIPEIEALLAGTERESAPVERGVASVDRLLVLLVKDDANAIDAELRAAAAALGPKRFVTELAHPLAVAVGEAWERGELEVHHEHLMSECLETQLRQQLAAYQDVEGHPLVLLATLPGELHALGLAMVALYLAVCAAKPRLLGATTPPEQIAAAARALHADAVGIAVASLRNRDETRRATLELLSHLPRRAPLWIGGSAASELGITAAGARVVDSWAALDRALAELRSSDRTRQR